MRKSINEAGYSEDLYMHCVEKQVIQSDVHVIMTNDLHTNTYANLALPLNCEPELFKRITQDMAEWLVRMKFEFHAVAATGNGSRYAQEVVRLLRERGFRVEFVWAERSAFGEKLEFHRDQEGFIYGNPVIIIDDVFSTGGTVRELIDLIVRHGGHVSRILVVLNRSNDHALEHRGDTTIVYSLIRHPITAWPANECPQCKEKKPFSTKFGKGLEHFRTHGQLESS